ncbi:hypothetical protein D9757_007646 [Collybiopsis confluens]|uniref:HD/PDEase domain-containing protein n=1 Tax=Collybiopsis confluens TaxID=2823264 RepID=A0A8H5H9U8_9AGAR|nr:hypothetical protein D9757_007646 [Collybiopsis confluens]
MATETFLERQRFIKDPIHDQILLTPRMCEFIDSRAFQRLRNIKQLGTTYFVWDGACHNRFEHSIGVGHLARLLVTSLRDQQPNLDITNRDIECVTLAGLLHDLGHGPWSHVWDSMLIPTVLPGETWTHEEGSEMMLDFLIKDKKIVIPLEDVQFIKALIAGDPSKCSSDEKLYLFEIVANKRNGLDVDKYAHSLSPIRWFDETSTLRLDYIQRDSYHIGEPITLQTARLIKSARVMENQICYEYKDLDKVFEVYQTRHKLHKTWYNHKTAKAIEFMIVDALLLAEPFLHIAGKIRKPEEFLYLTDNLKEQILASSDPVNLAPAQKLFRRIDERDLYRLVDKKWVAWGEREAYSDIVTRGQIYTNARLSYNQIPEAERKEHLKNGWSSDGLNEEDIVVEQTPLHYGMKEANPLEFVKFYSAKTGACDKPAEGSYSTLRPLVFAEVLLRIFTKKPQWLSQHFAGAPNVNPVPEHGQMVESEAPTTPVLEQAYAVNFPSTKSTTLSRHTSRTSAEGTQDPSIVAATPGSSFRPHSTAKISTANPFLTVGRDHGSPIKENSLLRKRNLSEAEEAEGMDTEVTAIPAKQAKTPSRPSLPNDGQVSPSPRPRKQLKRK